MYAVYVCVVCVCLFGVDLFLLQVAVKESLDVNGQQQGRINVPLALDLME